MEVEFWRSSERIGTNEAYRAYLDAFPDGFFARLARAAIARQIGGATSETGAPAPVLPQSSKPAGQGVDASRIGRIVAEADTGAVSFRVGDTFVGPGPLTIGWFGAKKQLLIPNGTWTIMSAVDGYSTHSTRIPMVAIGLASFEGNRLRSAILVVANSRPGPAWATWNEVPVCEQTEESKGRVVKEMSPQVRQCGTAKLVNDFNKTEAWKHPYSAPGYRNFLRLELDPLPALAVRTDMYFTDIRSGFMQVTRFDPVERLGAGAVAPSTLADVPAAIRDRTQSWARAYSKQAARGLLRELPFDDLAAGDRVPTVNLSLPD